MESDQQPASQPQLQQDPVDNAINEPSQPDISEQSDDHVTTPLAATQESDRSNSPPRTDTPMTLGHTPAAKAAKPTSLPVAPEDLLPVVGHSVHHNRGSSIPSSWSASSDRQLGHGGTSSNADPSDRVYPIRSVVSVDQAQPTPWILPRNSTELDFFPRPDTTWDGRRRPSNPRIGTDTPTSIRRNDTLSGPSSVATSPSETLKTKEMRRDPAGSPPPGSKRLPTTGPIQIFDDVASDGSDRTKESISQSTGSSQVGSSVDGESYSELNDALVTARFRYAMTGDGNVVITGRDGTLQRCEDEPIHTPGAVQAFGLLIALKEGAGGHLSVRIVSENSKEIIGFSPQELFRLKSFTDIFTEEQADNLLDHIDFIRDEEADPATNGPDVFSISIRPAKGRSIKLWCAMHVNDSHPNLIICEFELEDDHHYPLRPSDEMIPEEPEDTLYQNPTAEELQQSTEVSSKPLRVLRSARKRRGEAGAMQVFDIMSQVQEQLASAPNLERFLKILVGIVKELTGFHRVMIYQFDAAFNGKVVTELLDPMQTRDLYHGLHFPASDIPKQARDLYKLNKVRLLYDRELDSARLVCRSKEDLERPLDLSHAYLRAMSPIHLKYLANMAVRSSMSISITAFNELWGLIACHSYGSRGMRVAFPTRKMCRLVGDIASRNIERISYASRLQARKLINTMPTDKNPSGYIIASSDDLLKLFDADFGMLSIRGETKVLGKIEQSQEALAMLEYLRLRSYTTVLTTQDICEDFPDLRYPPGFSVIAGLLYVPLSVGGNDFIVFFRKGQIKEVKWAGNPYEKVIQEGTSNYLEPRSSFKVWYEAVTGKCREWTEEQVETAAVLCLVYGKFIEVWRQKEAALQSSRLTRLLLANSAHEVRTPLNAIINYLEIALEGALDQETRENLARSHSASKSLIYVINDLLDLTQTEEGQELIKDEVMDLPACVKEATDPFKGDANRKGLIYEVVEHPGVPRFVHGDYRRVRQAVANMISNAMQNTTEGTVKVEIYVTEVLESRVRVEITVYDTGCGMSNETLESLFQDLEQVSSADIEEPITTEDSEKSRDGRTLGLGLAVVARVVRNMDGQLRLKSEEGKGSRFVIQLPFELPTDDLLDKVGAGNATIISNANSYPASVTKSLPPTQTGEVMLVDRGSSSTVHATSRLITEEKSFDETNSASSFKSGASNSGRSNKSDAERLIDAIQTPLSLGDPDEEAGGIQRQNSMKRQHRANISTTSLPEPDANHLLTISASNPGRPSMPPRSTTNPPGASDSQAGIHLVTDNKTPIRPVKIPDEYFDQPRLPQITETSRVLFEIPENPKSKGGQVETEESSHAPPGKLQVLVAEDDPINMKILKKRLEKADNEVYHAVNGEDCAMLYRETPAKFDVILMDMQMPIVDGLTSTKMIRAFEQSEECTELSPLATSHGRIPIFAVSASLTEKEKPTYVAAGFDGWILKPIDFKRLKVLLEGMTNDIIREECVYKPGEWEQGGWFSRRPCEPARYLKFGGKEFLSSEDITPTGPVNH